MTYGDGKDKIMRSLLFLLILGWYWTNRNLLINNNLMIIDININDIDSIGIGFLIIFF